MSHIKPYIEERVLAEAEYIVATGATIRETAKAHRVSKSTVNKDMHGVCKELHHALYLQVRVCTDKNMNERAMRGGIATRKKYRDIMKEV